MPDWVKAERDQFTGFRDKDRDGFLDREEVQQWIMPDDYENAQAEAKHLVYMSDQDGVRPFTHVPQHCCYHSATCCCSGQRSLGVT